MVFESVVGMMVPNGGSGALLMIGSNVVVPLLQMAAINIFKVPRERGGRLP